MKNWRPAQNTTGIASNISTVIQTRSPRPNNINSPRPGTIRPMAIVTSGTVNVAASSTLRVRPLISAVRAVRSLSLFSRSSAASRRGS